jgi:hypothetical protein
MPGAGPPNDENKMKISYLLPEERHDKSTPSIGEKGKYLNIFLLSVAACDGREGPS